MTPLALLKKRYLSHTDRLRYQPNLEGQRIANDGTIYIGNRAGPSKALSHLVHELCHFVEVEDHRIASPHWGLKTPQVWICDRWCCEPHTRQMTERELRVISYQLNVLEALGAPSRAIHFVSALEYLADFIHVPLEDGRPAYGEGAPEADKLDYKDRITSRIRWMAKRAEALRSEFTLERFDREWARKIDLLSR